MLRGKRLIQGVRPASDQDPHLHQEWLLTNGLGGYASGTVSGELTRRYHGLLIAALPNPWGRYLMLTALSERCNLPKQEPVFLGSCELWGTVEHDCSLLPSEFSLELGFPVWTYRVGGNVVEKSLFMLNGQNTVHVNYRLVSSTPSLESLSVDVLAGLNFRPHGADVTAPLDEHFEINSNADGFEICAHGEGPVLRLACSPSVPRLVEQRSVQCIDYRTEQSRGYPYRGPVFTPGFFTLCLKPQEEVTFIASTDSWDVIRALSPVEARGLSMQRRRSLLQRVPPAMRDGPSAELVLAADQFVIMPRGRANDEIRAQVSGNELRTVIAGYYWFTDWGRDTMISLEGLTLTTGRSFEARWILRTFAHYIKNGLIPNMFPEGTNEGLYHTADATLWFFHALSRYWHATQDEATLRQILPALEDIVQKHIRGTSFGIHVDDKDGLLSQGAEGYQLTWMDAKVNGWVVTPRRGKAVEINALWYNALCLLAGWKDLIEGPGAGRSLAERAEGVRQSFNRRFWCQEKGYLYDVVDGENGDDPSCRPNQVFAISLPHEVLDQRHWEAVMQTAERKLLTPVGLRSLSPDDPEYKPRYDGDLRARDAAYHQGSVWAWLIGPYVDAWLKLHPNEKAEARKLLAGFENHLDEACVSSISEIFDAEPPHTPRGCIAQAWSVAEVLRSWANTATDELIKRV
jgi:predicted glycogen debranching enzyme